MIPIVIGLIVTLRGNWICDDAFISLRYVDNFERGLGLVYNPGERVEGYTHFLWVVLLALAGRTGIDLVNLGRYLPTVFHAGTLALLCVWSLRRATSARVFLPLAAWGVALHPDMQIWASGGLETAAFTFCVTATVLAASSRVVRPGVVATLAALATLFRPEGILLTASVIGILAWRKSATRLLARFAGVWILLVAPLFLWRAVYYHDWLPNTYYAKSAAVANWSQGWHYVALYFSVYPVLMIALAVAIVAGWSGRRNAADATLSCAVVSFVMLVYVLRVGGDFMFARFLIPITPLLYVTLEETVRRWRPAIGIPVSALVLATTLLSLSLREHILSDGKRAQGVVDEHKYYPRTLIDRVRRQGEEAAVIFRDTDVRVCILGSQASFAYFGRFPYVFERYGLTDRDVAHRPIDKRGRPGHERELSRHELMARRVHLIFRGEAKDRTGAPDEAVFGNLLASVVFYDRALMDSLRGRPGVELVDYPSYLDSIVERAAELSLESRRSAWAFARGYYFDYNSDPERYVRTRLALLGDVGRVGEGGASGSGRDNPTTRTPSQP